MAVVKLGRPVKSNLGGSNGAMAYIIDPAKTDGGRLVSSNYERTGTDYDALTDPMLEDNENSPKGIRKNSRLAYHIKLSFSPDDPVTPEKVHELGVEFAHRITSDEYKSWSPRTPTGTTCTTTSWCAPPPGTGSI